MPFKPTATPKKPSWPSRIASEIFGTFALTTTACGVEMTAALTTDVSHLERAAAPALMVLAMIYATSDVSGAHMNPAVTFSFALRRAFHWRWVPSYWAAQLFGAVLGTTAACAVFGMSAARSAMTTPKINAFAGLGVEVLLSLLLVSVILNTSERKGAVGPQAALAVGATIALCGVWGGPLTGASMNPARSLGPALLSRDPSHSWIYICGPLIGACVAVAITHLIHGPVSQDEEEAANGDGR